MASGVKTIYVVEGDGEVTLDFYDLEEVTFTYWLRNEGIQYLVNIANDKAISDYVGLENNGKYTRGPLIVASTPAEAKEAAVLQKILECAEALKQANEARSKAVREAVQRYQETMKLSDLASVGNTEHAMSFEDNAVKLLVKCIHNGGQFSISNEWRDRAQSKTSLPSKKAIDFMAEVALLPGRCNPRYPSCFCNTKQKKMGPIICPEMDLATPPILLPQGPTQAGRPSYAVFEITQDSDLWKAKLEKLNAYVGEMKQDVKLAGIVFPTSNRCKAIQNNVKHYPHLKALHRKRRFFYLVCDQTFVSSHTHSQASSFTRDLHALSAFTMELAAAAMI